MAIQKIKEGNSFNSYTQIFQIDSTDDLVTLEADYNPHFGDKAELPNGTVYVRHSDGYSGDLWEIAQSSGGGGSSLPAVTSEDNGDVLTVEDGAWAKAAPSGGGQFIITVTANEAETELSVDKTYQEIVSAFAEGKTFYLIYTDSLYEVQFAAPYAYESYDTYYIGGVNIDIEAVSEDEADICFLKIQVIANSSNGVTAYREVSYVSGTYSSIPPAG